MRTDDLTQRFLDNHPDACAATTFSRRQLAWYVVLALAAFGLLLYRWDIFLTLLNLVGAVFYFAMIAFRLLALARAWWRRPEQRARADELTAIADDELPVYTLLIPLYHEKEVARRLVEHLDAIDYPKDKLDIKLLLEEDDRATQIQIAEADLGPQYEVIVVPQSQPKTKPKACNYGLEKARGELIVIFDAEDRPDPDQLRQVAWAFRQCGEKVACIQARLDYYNPNQNLLTRWFTIEYAAWFGLFLPGLQTLGVPIPLGGTSNHFRTDLLRKLGGWDPWNVTEDCDLGVRLHKEGYRTIIIDSTTWEEANSRLGNWVRQRSRWVKGFLQTHLAHLRHPLDTWRRLGTWGTVGFMLTVGGVPLMLLLNTVYWAITAVFLGLMTRDLIAGQTVWEVLAGPRDLHRHAWKMIYYGPHESGFWSALSVIFFGITLVLLLANAFFVLINIAACLRRHYGSLLLAALISPIYWVLMSVAAWKGAWQLVTRPYYWEKTRHGLTSETGTHRADGARSSHRA